MSSIETMKFCLNEGRCVDCEYYSDPPMITCQELMRDAIKEQNQKYDTILFWKGFCAGAIIGMAIAALIIKLI